ncbi:MAG TPA: hypothetical protein VJ924_14645, partial [Alphaproteobacteria bacterium]|nr:hypothetical protein [Alphaproteobacteria bacterium]
PRPTGGFVSLVAALVLLLASDAWGQQPRMGPGPGMGSGMGAPMERGMGADAGMTPGRGMRMTAVDLNYDGFVSADEAAAWHEQVFLVFDVDEDDALSRDEYLAQHMGRAPGQGPRAAERGKARVETFDGMDMDRDGKVPLEEFLAWHAERFKSADKDGDGKVSVWEFRATRRW